MAAQAACAAACNGPARLNSPQRHPPPPPTHMHTHILHTPVSGSAVTSDVRYLPADQPLGEWRPVLPRKNETEYSVEDRGDHFFITIRCVVWVSGWQNWAVGILPTCAGGAFEGLWLAGRVERDVVFGFLVACRDEARPNSELLVAPMDNPTDTTGKPHGAAACFSVLWRPPAAFVLLLLLCCHRARAALLASEPMSSTFTRGAARCTRCSPSPSFTPAVLLLPRSAAAAPGGRQAGARGGQPPLPGLL
jgi:hypothetical protein